MKIKLLLGGAIAGLAACSSEPVELNRFGALQAPASAAKSVQPVTYAPAVRDYLHYEPTEPQDWRKSNEEQNSGWTQ